MTNVVKNLIQERNLIQKGDMVIAGVSGGADSVCLLLLLLTLSNEIGFALEAVHVEHGIRGEESLADAAFVEDLCGRLMVPCHVYHVDVLGCAERDGIGLEEEARILRYRCYETAAGKLYGEGRSGARKIRIALAHHADDNAETMLFQLIRGSGLKGLGGMPYEREFTEYAVIVRPLLGCTRSEIEAFLKMQGQTFCCDSTNGDVGYSRNRIRRRVMPELLLINDRAVSHMAQSAALLGEVADFFDQKVQEILPEVCTFGEEGCVIAEKLFLDYPLLLQREVVLKILGKAAGSSRDIGNVHVEAVIALFGRQTGRSIMLPYRLRAWREYKGIRIAGEETEKKKNPGIYEIGREQLYRAEQGECVKVGLPDGELRFRIFNFCGEIQKIPKKRYTKWLSYDKIKCVLQIRKRTAGDYLVIDESGHRKKLKDYFTGEKIPRSVRDEIWLLAENSHIIWVTGGRISADYKIEKNTQRILEVQITGGSYHED